jgi:hemerythrin-like domain-containing protein
MKRSTDLEPLSHDHYEGLLVTNHLRQGLANGADPEVMVAYVGHVWRCRLRHHFEQEERLLLPLLAALGADALAERMTGEHRVLQELVARLEAGEPAPLHLLDAFARGLQAHIRFEERTLFPELERRADEEALAAVGRQLQAHRLPADPGWKPAFWE